MIFQHPFGITPSIEISIGGVPVLYESIKTVELSLNEGEHDMVVLKMYGIPQKAIIEYIGAPVQIVLSRGNTERQEFVGEIAQIVPTNDLRKGAVNNSPFQEADIYCMGSSYKMRGSKSKVWGEKTLTDIATELASTYKFSLDVPKTTLLHSDTAQINKSDWVFLNEICDLYAYGLTVHGTHMHIWDPYRATGRQRSYHELFSVKETNYDPQPTPGVVLSFNGTFLSQPASETYTAVLDSQGNITSVSSTQFSDGEENSGLGKKFTTEYRSRLDAPAKSAEEAELAIKTSMRDSIPFYATIETLGVIGIYPGGIINLVGFDTLVDNLWYVKGVTMTLGGMGLTTKLEVVSDSTNEEKYTVYNTERFSDPPKPKFDGKNWVAEFRKINAYQ
jgi:hypothetical protein